MGTIVLAVDQPWLGSDTHLIQQRTTGSLCDLLGVALLKVVADQLHRLFEQLPNAVLLASRTGSSHLVADQTFSRRHMQIAPGDLRHSSRHHINVKQPSHGKAVLNLTHQALNLHWLAVGQQIEFLARFSARFLLQEDRDSAILQLGQNSALALGKGAGKKRRSLDCAGNIQRKADKRSLLQFHHAVLALHPLFPRVQNLLHRKRRTLQNFFQITLLSHALWFSSRIRAASFCPSSLSR